MVHLLLSPAVLRVSPFAQPVVLIEPRCSQHIDQPESQCEPEMSACFLQPAQQ